MHPTIPVGAHIAIIDAIGDFHYAEVVESSLDTETGDTVVRLVIRHPEDAHLAKHGTLPPSETP